MIKGFIRGIMSLFTTGVIFDPMVILGMVFSIFINSKYSTEYAFEIYKNYFLYISVLVISSLYVFFFRKTYKLGGRNLDVEAMLLLVLGCFAKAILSSFLMTSFIIFLFF